MASRTISTRLVIEGEAEYKAKLKSINAELALHKSELAKAESAHKSDANSLKALTEKNTALSAILEKQKERFQEIQAQLEKAKKVQEDYSGRVAEAKANLEQYNQRLAEVESGEARTRKERQAQTATIKELNALIEKEAAAQSRATAMQEQASEAVRNYQRQANNAETAVNNWTF